MARESMPLMEECEKEVLEVNSTLQCREKVVEMIH